MICRQRGSASSSITGSVARVPPGTPGIFTPARIGPGGAVHVESTTPRHFWNAGDEDLVLLALGGKDGYVERDGHMVDPADVERRWAFSRGDVDVIRRRER